jgi:adenosylcobinamide-phosphate guanylyltransferase
VNRSGDDVDAPPALVMCGGRGTRFDIDVDVEKPLFAVDDRAMVDRVCEACLDTGLAVHAAVSQQAPATAAHLRARGDVAVVETPGDGYVTDLIDALRSVGRPAMTVAADLPLLGDDALTRVVEAARDDENGRYRDLTVLVPVALKRALGASVDDRTLVDAGGRPLDDTAGESRGFLPAGVNVVGEVSAADTDTHAETHTGNTTMITYDPRFAVNVNRPTDADLAEAFL